MAAVTSISFTALSQSPDRKFAARSYSASSVNACKLRSTVSYDFCSFRASSSTRMVVRCMTTVTDLPTVSETKMNFLKSYKRPIPSVYNTVLQELLVQQHLTRYKRSYQYDPVYALGFVTVYDQLMEGYPSDEDRDAIFKAYIEALKEDPAQYRTDAQKLEEWAREQSASSLVDFALRNGEVEDKLKDIAERAGSKGNFCYSRFFAVGLFRLLELANASEPTVLDKLCNALNINKKSVDRDLDIYRTTLSKLVQAKELLKEYVEREKKKIEERASTAKGNEAVTKCLGEFQSVGRSNFGEHLFFKVNKLGDETCNFPLNARPPCKTVSISSIEWKHKNTREVRETR